MTNSLSYNWRRDGCRFEVVVDWNRVPPSYIFLCSKERARVRVQNIIGRSVCNWGDRHWTPSDPSAFATCGTSAAGGVLTAVVKIVRAVLFSGVRSSMPTRLSAAGRVAFTPLQMNVIIRNALAIPDFRLLNSLDTCFSSCSHPLSQRVHCVLFALSTFCACDLLFRRRPLLAGLVPRNVCGARPGACS